MGLMRRKDEITMDNRVGTIVHNDTIDTEEYVIELNTDAIDQNKNVVEVTDRRKIVVVVKSR
jgi:hypothetical protein